MTALNNDKTNEICGTSASLSTLINDLSGSPPEHEGAVNSSLHPHMCRRSDLAKRRCMGLLESGWVLANPRLMGFHTQFFTRVFFCLIAFVGIGVITGADIVIFLATGLPISAALTFLARHLVLFVHMLGHYLEARKQRVLAEEVVEKVKASGLEEGIEPANNNILKDRHGNFNLRRAVRYLRWYAQMLFRIPYGKYPGVERTGSLFMPNLFVRTKGCNIAVDAKGPEFDKKVATVFLGAGIPLFIAAVVSILNGVCPSNWLLWTTRYLLVAGVIAALDVHRTDNDAYRRFKEEKKVARVVQKVATAGQPAFGAILERLTCSDGRISQCTIPVTTSIDRQELLVQSHSHRAIFEGRGHGANVSMGRFGIVVLDGHQRRCNIFTNNIQRRIKSLLQEIPGLSHLGLSTSGSERGTLSYGSVKLEHIEEPPPEDRLSDEEAVRVLFKLIRDCGGQVYGTGTPEPGRTQVILSVAPETDKLARAYKEARHTSLTGKYLFDLKEGEKIEADSKYLIRLYKRWRDIYGVRLFINPFAEDDIQGYTTFKKDMGDTVVVATSNLFKSNADRLRSFANEQELTELADAIVLLPAQAGTLSELVAAAIEAGEHGLQIIMGRSPEATTDPLEADLALGLGAFMDDFGAARSVEVLDKISRKEEIMNIFSSNTCPGKPDRSVEDVKIADMKAYSFLTNARVPTMRVTVTLSNGAQFYADSPVGQFITQDKAHELDVPVHLVDGNKGEYQGNNCRIAIKHFDEVVAPFFKGMSIWDLPNLIDIETMLLAKEKELSEDRGLLPKYSNAELAVNQATKDLVGEKVLGRRFQVKEALRRKAALGLQPILGTSIVLARILAYRDGKELVQLVREMKVKGVDEDYLYGFADHTAHLQGHWILANHNFMGFHVAFLTEASLHMCELVVAGAIEGGSLRNLLFHHLTCAVGLCIILSVVILGAYKMFRYLKGRKMGRLSDETVIAIRKSGIEEGVDGAGFLGLMKRVKWYMRLFYRLPLGKYPGVQGIAARHFIGLVAISAFFALGLFKLFFPSDDVISFFVRELFESVIFAAFIGNFVMGAHEAGHYVKARMMNRLVPEVVNRVKEHPIVGSIEKKVLQEEDNKVFYRDSPCIKMWLWKMVWWAYIVVTAPIGRFPGVELSGGLFAPNLTVRTTVQGKDALLIRAAGPRVDRVIFLCTIIPFILTGSLATILLLKGIYPHLTEWILIGVCTLFGITVVSGLDISATDCNAYKQQKRERLRTARLQSELKEALEDSKEESPVEDIVVRGKVIDNPRKYFIDKHFNPTKNLQVVYNTKDGTRLHILPPIQERNTIQGGLHVDLIEKGRDLLGGYEVRVAIGNLHLQEFTLIPDTDDEEKKAAICTAIQLKVVDILNEYRGLVNVGQGLEGGQAVNLSYGAIPWTKIPGYEWIAEVKYPAAPDDTNNRFYMEEIHESDNEKTKLEKGRYQIAEEEAWRVLLLAIINAGYTPGNKIVPEEVLKEKPRVWLGMDGALSSLFFEYNRERGVKRDEDCQIGYRFWKDSASRELVTEDWIRIYKRWLTRYPIAWIEDPFGETDREAWKILYNTKLPDGRRIGDSVIIIGDDNVTTDESAIRRGKREKAFNTILIKLNQIGTVSETARAVVASLESVIRSNTYEFLDEMDKELARLKAHPANSAHIKQTLLKLIDALERELIDEEKQVYNVVVSHRSQSPDDWIEAAVGLGSNALGGKWGGSLNLERQSKYFHMLMTINFVQRGINMWKYRPHHDKWMKAGKDITIVAIRPQEIYCNSGTPTVRVAICLSTGEVLYGACPIGTSAGTTEAVHGLDYKEDEFKNKGCLTAVTHCQRIGEEFEGESIWSKKIGRNMSDLDRRLVQMEYDELKYSGDLQDIVDKAITAAKARGINDAEELAGTEKDVITTCLKRKRKIWMNAILPTSIGFMRVLAFRDGMYDWEVFRNEIHNIILSRMPKYAQRDEIRHDIHFVLGQLRKHIDHNQLDARQAQKRTAELKSRIKVYWAGEDCDGHADYLYGFKEEFDALRDWTPDMSKDAGKEFKLHRLFPEHEISCYCKDSGQPSDTFMPTHVTAPSKDAVTEAPMCIFSLFGCQRQRPNSLSLCTVEKVLPDELTRSLEMLKGFSEHYYGLYTEKIKDACWYSPSQGSCAVMQYQNGKRAILLLDRHLKVLREPRPADVVIYLLLVEATSYLALPSVDDDLNIKLTSCIGVAQAYYRLTPEQRNALRSFVQEYKNGKFLLKWLTFLDGLDSEKLRSAEPWPEFADFIVENYEHFGGQSLDLAQVRHYLTILKLGDFKDLVQEELNDIAHNIAKCERERAIVNEQIERLKKEAMVHGIMPEVMNWLSQYAHGLKSRWSGYVVQKCARRTEVGLSNLVSMATKFAERLEKWEDSPYWAALFFVDLAKINYPNAVSEAVKCARRLEKGHPPVLAAEIYTRLATIRTYVAQTESSRGAQRLEDAYPHLAAQIYSQLIASGGMDTIQLGKVKKQLGERLQSLGEKQQELTRKLLGYSGSDQTIWFK